MKTNGGYKSKKTAMPMSAADSLKRQYVKTKAELKKQTEEQNERPENYAVEDVEDRAERAAYAAADVAQQSVKYAVGRIRERKVQKIDIPEIPVSGNTTQEPAHKQLEAPKAESNANKPKDKQLMPDRQKIKARNDATVKAKERTAPVSYTHLDVYKRQRLLSEDIHFNNLETMKFIEFGQEESEHEDNSEKTRKGPFGRKRKKD